MFGITLKRSAATLGVVAGLLAAAAPAGATPTTPTANGFLIDFTNTGVKAPADADLRTKDKAVVVLIGANDYGWTAGDDKSLLSG